MSNLGKNDGVKVNVLYILVVKNKKNFIKNENIYIGTGLLRTRSLSGTLDIQDQLQALSIYCIVVPFYFLSGLNLLKPYEYDRLAGRAIFCHFL